MRKKKKDEELSSGEAGAAAPGEPAVASEPRRVTPIDIQQKVFRQAVRGYNERDVDSFLDEVTEEVALLVADNKRLREQIEMLGMRATTPLAAGGVAGATEANDIVRRAREEAASIIAEARAQADAIRAQARAESAAGAVAGAVAGEGSAALAGDGEFAALTKSFVYRERDFLQSLAELIQRHAEAVKEDLRRTRTPPADPRPVVPEASTPEPGEGPGRAAVAAGTATALMVAEAPEETEARDTVVASNEGPAAIEPEGPVPAEAAAEEEPASPEATPDVEAVSEGDPDADADLEAERDADADAHVDADLASDADATVVVLADHASPDDEIEGEVRADRWRPEPTQAMELAAPAAELKSVGDREGSPAGATTPMFDETWESDGNAPGWWESGPTNGEASAVEAAEPDDERQSLRQLFWGDD